MLFCFWGTIWHFVSGAAFIIGFLVIIGFAIAATIGIFKWLSSQVLEWVHDEYNEKVGMIRELKAELKDSEEHRTKYYEEMCAYKDANEKANKGVSVVINEIDLKVGGVTDKSMLDVSVSVQALNNWSKMLKDSLS